MVLRRTADRLTWSLLCMTGSIRPSLRLTANQARRGRICLDYQPGGVEGVFHPCLLLGDRFSLSMSPSVVELFQYFINPRLLKHPEIAGNGFFPASSAPLISKE